jgi:predicted TPR repeat methyltransferase/Flp pilus assembly protein TadD
VEIAGAIAARAEAEATLAQWAAAEPRVQAWLAAGLPPAQALLRCGSQLVQQNRFAEAIGCLRATTILAPLDPNGWTNYGVALDRAQALPEAIAALERSLSLSHHQPDTWLLLGLTRGKMKDAEGAEAAFRIALAQEPESALVWQCLGLLKEAQKEIPEAIECFRACLQRGRATAALCANLGKLLHQTGRIAESAAAYRDAVALEPGNLYFQEMARKVRFLQLVMESPTIDEALERYRSSRVPAGEATGKDLEAVFHAAFGFLSGFGHRDAAIRLGKKHLELWPNSSSMSYLLSALEGKPGLDRAPADYIAEHFDAFAEGFDTQLVGALGYDLPEQIGASVRAASEADRRYDAVDAGCGTGLCGPWLSPLARTLVGVDLASKMLAQAAKRGLYDELVCEDLTPFLLRSAGRFDLMTAADVLIYFGDLAPLFKAAAGAVRPGGLLVVSTESRPDGSYQVLSSGRFAHASAYVRAVAAADWIEVAVVETTLRLEATARVPGQLFVFRRRSGAT